MDNSNGAPGATTTPAESARRIKEAATHLVDRGREAAISKVGEGAERARTSAETAANALRRASSDVEQDSPLIATGLRKGADLLEQTLRSFGSSTAGSTPDLTQLVDGIHTFARRQPALFLGASLALGFALARVGKATIEGAVDNTGFENDGYQTPTPDVTPGL